MFKRNVSRFFQFGGLGLSSLLALLGCSDQDAEPTRVVVQSQTVQEAPQAAVTSHVEAVESRSVADMFAEARSYLPASNLSGEHRAALAREAERPLSRLPDMFNLAVEEPRVSVSAKPNLKFEEESTGLPELDGGTISVQVKID